MLKIFLLLSLISCSPKYLPLEEKIAKDVMEDAVKDVVKDIAEEKATTTGWVSHPEAAALDY